MKRILLSLQFSAIAASMVLVGCGEGGASASNDDMTKARDAQAHSMTQQRSMDRGAGSVAAAARAGQKATGSTGGQ